jgi:hypothetical protein
VKSLVNGPIPPGAGRPAVARGFRVRRRWSVAGQSATLPGMRETFHGDLARLGGQLAAMCGMAAESMRRASRALLTADLQLAERVLAG